jgi:hypothetical protein
MRMPPEAEGHPRGKEQAWKKRGKLTAKQNYLTAQRRRPRQRDGRDSVFEILSVQQERIGHRARERRIHYDAWPRISAGRLDKRGLGNYEAHPRLSVITPPKLDQNLRPAVLILHF